MKEAIEENPIFQFDGVFFSASAVKSNAQMTSNYEISRYSNIIANKAC